MPRVVAHPSKVNTAKNNAQRGNVFLFILPPGESIAPGEWRDPTFHFFAMFPVTSCGFCQLSIPFLIKPAVLLVNLLSEFSVGSIYLGFQLAAFSLILSRLFGGFSSEFLSLPHRVFCRVPPQVFDLPIMFSAELKQFSTCLIRCPTGKGFVSSSSTIPLLDNINTRLPVNDFSCLIHCPVNDVGNNVLNRFFYVTGLDRR